MSLTEEKVSTPVGKIQVFRGGAGRPVVYLHSATGETTMGTPFLDDLSATFDVVAPAFPGFGESEGIEQIDDIEDAAFFLADLIDSLGLQQPALVGMSLGGWLAAEVATRWPERVAKLVLINPAGLYIAGDPIKEIFGRDPGELADDLFADRDHPLAQAMHQMGELMSSRADIPFELVKPVAQSLAATAKIAWNPYLHNPKLAGRLHRVSAPTLIVHGQSDALVPRSHAAMYADGIPDARLVDVPGGHLLVLERSADVVPLVREFLA